MADLIPTFLFYILSAITIGSGVMVISSKNPVHSVLFLILAFFTAAGLFILLGAEFIAMTLIIVYVGAVAVLFLFVVMMLDIDFTELRSGFLEYLPMGAAIAAIVFFELLFVFYVSLHASQTLATAAHPIASTTLVSNTKAIGSVLYTWYLLPFQMAGVILLIAMIGAIVLCLRGRTGVRKQNVSAQQARHKRDGVTIVHVEPRRGIL